MFVGRALELAELGALLAEVRNGQRLDRGIAVMLRGRRRVGKSSLITRFVEGEGVPHVYFQAARFADTREELKEFVQAIQGSNLPNASAAEGAEPSTLTGVLTLLASALPDDQPSIVVIDEVPWLLEASAGGAGELQRAWDRHLSRKPVLLVMLGSDLAMMEELTGARQPFHGRASEMVLEPLTPRDVAVATGLAPFDAFDAYLITGGLPMAVQEWKRGVAPVRFVEQALSRTTSALVVSGMRIMDAEFATDVHARAILTAIGGRGERTFSGISNALSGQISRATLVNNLNALAHKRVIAADEPLSSKLAVKDRRWRIVDPSLRFWLAFVEPALGDMDRGRFDLAAERFSAGFPSWRGRAIEPLVRTALRRLLPDGRWPHVSEVGGWWPRSNNPEIDLIGADKRPASSIGFVGTIKWREKTAIGTKDIDALVQGAAHVPGVDIGTPLVAVTGSAPVNDPRVTQSWNASDLLEAWPA